MKGLAPMKSDAIVTKIDDFVMCLDKEIYDLPARKFVREFLAGILVARSTLISEICRSVTSNKRAFAALYQKFWRRLSEVDLTPAKLQQQNRAIREISEDTVIAIDVGDITKPHAKTLEALALVADGSDQHKVKPGYWLLGAVAVNPKFEDKTPQPLELKIYSSASETFESENAVINEFIADIYLKTKGKGIYVIDRGGDRIKIIRPLCELKGKFVIRLKDRYLYDVEKGAKIRIKNHIDKRSSLPYGVMLERRTKNGKRVPMRLRFGFSKVKVPDLERTGVEHETTLVTAWSDKSQRPMELLTTMQVSDISSAIQVIINYLSRWSVEETYRFLKVDSKLEKLQLRSFGKLQNMIAACFIAASTVARMARCSSWQAVFEKRTRRQKRAPHSLYNWTYRAADAIANILKTEFSAIRKLNQPRPPGRRFSHSSPRLIPLEFGI